MDRFCPFDVEVDTVAAFVNAELNEHSVYDGFEIQWFDDPEHGTGMLAFLQRRQDRKVDYYVQPGLEIDRSTFELGGGTGQWVETAFEANHLAVDRDGAVADVRFRDVDGRAIEIRIDDRDAGPRRTGGLLAPVSAAIDGVAVDADGGIRRRSVRRVGATAELSFDPAVPSVTDLSDGQRSQGDWVVAVDDIALTGGRWGLERRGDRVEARMLLTRRWRPPAGQPALMRLVTRVVPTFRRWPTTYRWRATIALGDLPLLSSRWERTTATW